MPTSWALAEMGACMRTKALTLAIRSFWGRQHAFWVGCTFSRMDEKLSNDDDNNQSNVRGGGGVCGNGLHYVPIITLPYTTIFFFLCDIHLLALSIGQSLCINSFVSRANFLTTLRSHLDVTCSCYFLHCISMIQESLWRVATTKAYPHGKDYERSSIPCSDMHVFTFAFALKFVAPLTNCWAHNLSRMSSLCG